MYSGPEVTCRSGDAASSLIDCSLGDPARRCRISRPGHSRADWMQVALFQRHRPVALHSSEPALLAAVLPRALS
jgi:hypothetical protein